MEKDECLSLAAHFRELTNKGLVDVKFYVRALDEAASGPVCAEVSALYRARAEGKSQPLNFNDSQRGIASRT